MGWIGGELAYRFLRSRYPGGSGVPMAQDDPYAARGESKLSALFGPGIFEELAGLSVVDFGCGTGEHAIDLARRSTARVTGFDIRENVLAKARAAAEAVGVTSRCHFTSSLAEPADAVISMDAMEHFADPASALAAMHRLLRPEGFALIEFGYPWLHPYGGHLFSVFPWAHLLFTEAALIRWRSDFKKDGATRFENVPGGLNRMTIARWERLVAASPFAVEHCELVPIRGLERWHNRWSREWLTSIVRARLRPKFVAGPA